MILCFVSRNLFGTNIKVVLFPANCLEPLPMLFGYKQFVLDKSKSCFVTCNLSGTSVKVFLLQNTCVLTKVKVVWLKNRCFVTFVNVMSIIYILNNYLDLFEMLN